MALVKEIYEGSDFDAPLSDAEYVALTHELIDMAIRIFRQVTDSFNVLVTHDGERLIFINDLHDHVFVDPGYLLNTNPVPLCADILRRLGVTKKEQRYAPPDFNKVY